jgi:EAL domain-containing protein (putative c-di-GMP-specific phosphodiesterase class I)
MKMKAAALSSVCGTGPSNYARFVREETIRAVFQPVEHLKTGQIVGFEALARLEVGGTLIYPAIFLPGLLEDDLLRLFCAMIGKSLEFLKARAHAHPDLYLSVNVEPGLLLKEGFFDALRMTLDRYGFAGKNLLIELLEGDEIVDVPQLRESLRRVQALGIATALDDIGSAYSSLTKLRDLPIDIVKLDQSFARGLEERPEDLHFILSLLTLTRGLRKRLVVEGAETLAIHDALRVLGVDHAQGYTIARPMDESAVDAWLADRQPRLPNRTPTSMLGAYAAHLLVTEACRGAANQPLPFAWTNEAKDPYACAIGQYFDRVGLHDTACGMAHKHFHKVMDLYTTDRSSWKAGADAFRRALEQALAEHRVKNA